MPAMPQLAETFRATMRLLHALAARIDAHRIGLAAAGCAFYATLALFPAASMLISLFGLAFNPHSIEPQLRLLQPLLPEDAFSLIERLILGLTAKPSDQLSLAVLIGALVALWGASASTKSVIEALSLAYDQPERRSLLRFQGVALMLTMAAITGALLALALLVALPAIAAFMGLPKDIASLLFVASLGVMMLYVTAAIAVLYRFGPSRNPHRARRILPGTIAATLLWLAASTLFSIYAESIAHFDATYGPLGAIATVMLWFWVSFYAVLIGAELNAAVEIAR